MENIKHPNQNGYVIYPSNVSISDRAIAVSVAEQMSRTNPFIEYRVQNADTGETIARFRAGEEIE